MNAVRHRQSKSKFVALTLSMIATIALLVSLTGVSPVAAAPTAPALPAASQQVTQCGTSDRPVNPTISISRNTIGLSETATVTVSGKDYYQPVHRCDRATPGGVYVFFGWVAPGGAWGPSHRGNGTNGIFGYTFSYPGEGGGEETREDDTGAIRFVSFSKHGESAAATDYHMDANGGWSTTITVRGAAYGFVNVMTNQGSVVDCTQVQCGIFTIGGHGVSSRQNEIFTPINFVDPSGSVAPPGSGVQTPTPGATTPNPGVHQAGQGGAIAHVDPGLVQDSGQNFDVNDLKDLEDLDPVTDNEGNVDGETTEGESASGVEAIGVGGGDVGQRNPNDVEITTEGQRGSQAAGSVDFGSQSGGTPWVVIIGVVVVLAALIGGGVAMTRKRANTTNGEL